MEAFFDGKLNDYCTVSFSCKHLYLLNTIRFHWKLKNWNVFKNTFSLSLVDSMGRMILAGGAAVGLGALCYYGLGMSNEIGAIEKAVWVKAFFFFLPTALEIYSVAQISTKYLQSKGFITSNFLSVQDLASVCERQDSFHLYVLCWQCWTDSSVSCSCEQDPSTYGSDDERIMAGKLYNSSGCRLANLCAFYIAGVNFDIKVC